MKYFAPVIGALIASPVMAHDSATAHLHATSLMPVFCGALVIGLAATLYFLMARQSRSGVAATE